MDKVIKMTPILIAVWCATYEQEIDNEYFCGNCPSDEWWTPKEFLYNETKAIVITACCHAEAIYACDARYETEAEDLTAQDEASYRYAVTGR